MGTGYHAIYEAGVSRRHRRRAGPRSVGLCAIQAATALGQDSDRGDTVAGAPGHGRSLAPRPSISPTRRACAAGEKLTEGLGADVTVDASAPHVDAFDMACRLTRKAGTVFAMACTPTHGVTWASVDQGPQVRTGHANVIGHVDAVLD